MSRIMFVEETRSRHVNKDLCFIMKKSLVQVYMFHGKKYNVTKRLMVLLDTTASFSHFTYFEFSK